MIEFGVLGPLLFRRDGQVQPVPTEMLRRLLAVLLARAGSPVPVDTILDALWPVRLPPSARRTLTAYVSRLRGLLGADATVEASRGYYALHPGSCQVDASTFRSLVDEAAVAIRRGDRAATGRTLARALRLWRGPAFDGLRDTALVAAEAESLEQLRLASFEQWAELEIAAGGYTRIEGELDDLITAHPYRERLRGLRMLALYRGGRQAEALETYRFTYRLLADELGVEPSVMLSQLHQRILAGDPVVGIDGTDPVVLTNPPPVGALVTPPRLLPPDIPDFVGRARDLDWLNGATSDTTVAVIHAIAGTGGIGKTALAVHWAHQIADQFPDGQLYVDLQGFHPGRPLPALEALRHLLRALGTSPDRLPHTLEHARDMFRSALADRAMLVVLDNAAHVDQVRPLLPSAPGCMTVVTSRDALSGLIARDGARRLILDTLPPKDAHALLVSIIGLERANAEPDALRALAALCGHLPLALRIAAVCVMENPTQRIGGYVDRLRTGDRIGALAIDDDPASVVRTVFDYSYRELPTEDRRTFRMIGLLPGGDFSAEAVAELAGVTPAAAGQALGRLRTAHLVFDVPSGRFGTHDLLREYAAGHSVAEDGPDIRSAATQRLLGWYLAHTEGAARVLYPTGLALPPTGPPHEFVAAADAIEWLGWEEQNIRSAIEGAIRDGHVDLAWSLTSSLRNYSLRQRATVELTRLVELSLPSAEAAQNERIQTMLHIALMDSAAQSGHLEEAVEAAERTYHLALACGWLEAQVAALNMLGFSWSLLGDIRRARDCLAVAIGLFDSHDVAYRRSTTLSRQGIALGLLGDLSAAAEHLERALKHTESEGGRPVCARHRPLGARCGIPGAGSPRSGQA